MTRVIGGADDPLRQDTSPLPAEGGVLEARAIAGASDRVWCLSFGAEDYAASTGCETTPEGL